MPMTMEEAVSAIVENRSCIESYDSYNVEDSVVDAMIGALVLLGQDESIARRAGNLVRGNRRPSE